MNQDDYYVPAHLDAPARMFFWDMDEFMAMMGPLGVGIFIHQLILGVVMGLIAAKLIKGLKAGRGRGIMAQALYWYLPSDKVFSNFKRTPHSHIREFVG